MAKFTRWFATAARLHTLGLALIDRAALFGTKLRREALIDTACDPENAGAT
jgi:hypothetical protein